MAIRFSKVIECQGQRRF